MKAFNPSSKYFVLCLIATIMVLMNVSTGYADHNKGGEITYEFEKDSAGGSWYYINIRLYGGKQQEFTVKNTSSAIDYNKTYDFSGESAPKPCEDPYGLQAQCTTYPVNPNCSDKYEVVVRELRYRYFFPEKSRHWVISARESLRAFTIETITTSDIYIETRLNNLDRQANSPQFNRLQPFLTVGDTNRIELNAEKFNDSTTLEYEWVRPRSGENQTIAYNDVTDATGENLGPSYQNPVGKNSISYTKLNSNTGLLTIYPPESLLDKWEGLYNSSDGSFQSVAAIKVTETDQNGNVISSVIRDFQLFVIPPPDHSESPSLSGWNGTNSNTVTVSLNDPTISNCNKIYTSAPDESADVTIDNVSFEGDVHDASADYDNAEFEPTLDICWNPQSESDQLEVLVKISGDSICQSITAVRYYINASFNCEECVTSFSPKPGKKYVLSAWVKEEYLGNSDQSDQNNFPHTYKNSGVRLSFNDGDTTLPLMKPSGPITEGWQRIEEAFRVPANANNITVDLVNQRASGDVYFDDIRLHPFRSNMKSFVYDPSTRRLRAELDENNYATYYEYDDEGQLIRIRKETERGVKTIQESRQNQSKVHIEDKHQ